MPAPARNAPCPCGSGRKYKACCLAVLEQRDTAWRTANRASRTVFDTVLRVGAAMWPTRESAELVAAAWADMWLGDPPTVDPEPSDMALLAPWMTYHWRPQGDERVLAQMCLGAAPRSFSTDERAWIDASIAEPFSLFEVLEVVPGECVRVHDLLLDEERVVYERTATKTIAPRSVLFACAPTFRGIATFDGMFPYTLPPGFRDELRASVGAVLGPFASFDRTLLCGRSAELLTLFAAQVVAASAPRRTPTLANNDGELVVMCELRWRIHDRSIAAVRRCLSTLDTGDPRDMFEADTASRWMWCRPDAAGTTTALGSVWIDGKMLVADCNSDERADRLRRMIESCCGELVSFVAIDRTTQAQMRESARRDAEPPAKERPPSPRELQAITQYLSAHYDAWPDASLPALGGRTPREAATTAKGRREVDALLREMEHDTSRTPMAGLYDFGRLRRALGL